jgi:hypothetical protein
MMTLTLNIPDPVLRRFEATCQDIPTAVLEGFAADGYRNGTLSRAEVGELLGHRTRWETEDLLARHDAWPAPTLADVTEDLEQLKDLPLP